MSKLDKITAKIMKFAQLKYVKILMNAFLSIAAFSIGSSIFNLVKSIPIPVWQTFLTNSGLGAILSIPVTVVSNLYAVMVAICVGYQLAISFDEKPLPVATVAFGAFMILTPFQANVSILNDAGEKISGVASNVLPLSNLGSQGIFLAMFSALLAARIYVFLIKKNIKIKMPDSIPPAVAGMFESMIPTGIVFIVFLIIRCIFAATPYGSAQTFIYTVLQGPLVGIGANPVGCALYLLMDRVFWMFGIHGGMLMYAALGSVRSAASMANIAAFAAGETVPYVEWGLLTMCTDYALVAISILLILCKAKQYKTLGKMSFATSLFNIGEPLMFGMPIILNPIMAIPYIFTPIMNLVLTSSLMKAGILPMISGASLSNVLPVPIALWMSTRSIWGLVWGFVLLALNIVIFFPFIKVADRIALKQEAQEELVEE